MTNSPSRYLVDTSVWIGIQRGELTGVLKDRLALLIAESRIATNDVIKTEMLVGSRTQREYAVNAQRFQGLVQLGIDASAWNSAAGLGFALRRKGVSVGLPDLVIAASALQHDAVVVHADGDFDNIARHSDLRVESYTESSG